MSAMETMAANMLKALGIDPEAIKNEVTTRVEQFETNIDRLNNTLTRIEMRLIRIEEKLEIPPLENQPPIKVIANGETGILNIDGSAS